MTSNVITFFNGKLSSSSRHEPLYQAVDGLDRWKSRSEVRSGDTCQDSGA